MYDSDQNDLDWLAFRYVAGELTPDQTTQFERRLADDQTARDAVAETVGLAQAIGALDAAEWAALECPATASLAASVKRGWARPLGWMLAGAAASLLLFVSVLSIVDRGGDTPVADDRSDSKAPVMSPELAAAYLRSPDVLTEVHADVDLASADELSAERDPLGDAASDRVAEDLEEAAPPSPAPWMVAAISGLQDRGSRGQLSPEQ